jgi:hypothetical protein
MLRLARWTRLLSVAILPACGAPDPVHESREAPAAHEEAHAHDAAAGGGEGEALRPIMQRLGAEMNTLTYALMTDDTAGVARSAAAIAQHVPISADELARIRAELGPGMARFETLDAAVHAASLRLRDAARGGDPDTIVARLGEVQRGCIACHEQFRERLRTVPPDR